MGERGESAGDLRLRDIAGTAGDGDQGPLGQAVVEPGRGRVGDVSRAGRVGAGGDCAVDRGQGAGDVQEPVRLGAADAELGVAVRRPRAVGERLPDAGGVRVPNPGSEHCDRAPDVVHRLAQPGCHLAGLRGGQRRPHRFGDAVLVLVVLAHVSIVLRGGGPDQGDGSAAAGISWCPIPVRGPGSVVGPGMELAGRIETLSNAVCDVWTRWRQAGGSHRRRRTPWRQPTP
ncbi:hypothetical protein ACIOHO_39310 [Streptomyces sp. NPDC087849]|uniref:hypothetical protein n=1 Tax=Streptomyces sp. NPDC087849 TaxID=3365808 RepID=UPI0037F92B65